MELTAIGQGHAQCTLLRYRKVNILLDCALSIQSINHAKPKGKEQAAVEAASAGSGRPRVHAPSHTTLPLLKVPPILGPLLQSCVTCTSVHSPLPGAGRKVPRRCLVQVLGQAGQGLVLSTSAEEAAAGSSAAAASSSSCSSRWALPAPAALGWQVLPGVQQQAYEACWQGECFTEAEAEACFSMVQVVRYGQHVSVDDMYLGAVAYPSGSGMGHALWVISDGTNRIGYAPRLCLAPGHALEVEPGTLSGLNALILASGCTQTQQQQQQQQQQEQQQQQQLPQQHAQAEQTQHHVRPTVTAAAGAAAAAAAAVAATAPGASKGEAGPTSQQHALPSHLGQAVAAASLNIPGACLQAVATARSGGCVLIPVAATGAAWPLLESLLGALDQAGLQDVPLMYIGPAARDSLALACTCPEFVSRSRQAQVYHADSPFPFDALIASGRLLVAPSLADPQLQARWREPCVVVASLCSFSAGPVQQLLRRWGEDARNLLLLGSEEPAQQQAAAAEAAAFFAAGLLELNRPLAMRVLTCQLAPPVPSAEQLAKLLDMAQPCHLIAWATDCSRLCSTGSTTRDSAAWRRQLTPYCWLQQLKLELLPKSPFLPVSSLPSQRLTQLGWKEFGEPQQELLAARFTGTLKLHDGAWHLEPLSASQPAGKAATAKSTFGSSSATAGRTALCWGRPTLTGLLHELQQRGLPWLDVRMEEGKRKLHGQAEDIVILRLEREQGEIRLGTDWATVSSGSAALRGVLQDCLKRHLSVL